MSNKLVFLDRATLGHDLDLKAFEQFGLVEIYEETSPHEILPRIKTADIVITNKVKIGREALQSCSLKGICITATGMDNIDQQAAKERGVKVLNAKGYSTESVVEHTLALYFQLSKKLTEHHQYVASGKWSNSSLFTCTAFPFEGLKEKNWGIIGLGAIGERLADILCLLGANISYYSTSGNNQNSKFVRKDLRALLSESDIISLHCPLNSATKGLLGREELNWLKPGALLLNLARGQIVDEQELINVIKGKKVKIGFDVFAQEPIELASGLLKLANENEVLLTPHVAWASKNARQRLLEITIQNLRELLF